MCAFMAATTASSTSLSPVCRANAARAGKPAAAPVTPAKPKLAAVPISKDDFKNDPLIQKALEIFKGQIVEVRA